MTHPPLEGGSKNRSAAKIFRGEAELAEANKVTGRRLDWSRRNSPEPAISKNTAVPLEPEQLAIATKFRQADNNKAAKAENIRRKRASRLRKMRDALLSRAPADEARQIANADQIKAAKMADRLRRWARIAKRRKKQRKAKK